MGYQIETDHASLAYLPDHEPALGARGFPLDAEWTSGFDVAQGAICSCTTRSTSIPTSR